jgi:hypothetical protein
MWFYFVPMTYWWFHARGREVGALALGPG